MLIIVRVSAWNPHYIKDKKLIEKVQRRFTKMINNMEENTYEERLQCLKLWTLEERRNRQDLIEVFKICNGLSRIRLNELFTLDDNIKGTRGHSWKLAKFRCKRKERKSIYIAPFRTKVHTKRSGMDHTVLPANNTMPAFPS